MSATSIPPGVVVVGAGQGGGEAVAALRQHGYAGSITLVGDEPHAPYRRPPLSKTFLLDGSAPESLLLKSAEAYARLGIDCRWNTRVTGIDRSRRVAHLSDGTDLPYAHLVLATGGRARRLDVPGSAAEGVHTIRTIADVERLRADFEPDRRLVVIGGGYIGLEAASAGVKKGLSVTVIESQPRVLSRVAAPELSAFYEQAHRGRGVQVLTGSGVRALHGTPRVASVELVDGRRIEADLVIAGLGLVPDIELALQCGLQAENGAIVVDAATRTSDSAIFAIGDCTVHRNRFYDGRLLRVESVPNATEQARVAAANICGKEAEHAAVPWFWSDQFDLKLQMVGLSDGYDALAVRGSMQDEAFIAFYLKDGVVISADAVNRPQDFIVAKNLVARRIVADVADLTDPEKPLKALLQ